MISLFFSINDFSDSSSRDFTGDHLQLYSLFMYNFNSIIENLFMNTLAFGLLPLSAAKENLPFVQVSSVQWNIGEWVWFSFYLDITTSFLK